MAIDALPIEQFYIAARSAAAGRRLRDPVLLLAAAKIARQLGQPGVATTSARTEAAALGSAPYSPQSDSRPSVAALRSDARTMASGGAEEALIDLLDGQVAETPDGTPGLAAIQSTIAPASAMVFPAPAARSVVVAGDGRSPLRCTRDSQADPEAGASLAFLVAAGDPKREGLIRVENIGRYPVDVLCVWQPA